MKLKKKRALFEFSSRMLPEDSLALVCADMCLQVHQILPKVTQPVRIVPGKIDERACATWLTKGAQFFTLIKSGTSTLAYCHANRTLYYANPSFRLGDACPDQHAFLAQTVEDREPNGEVTPRLLIMDLVYPTHECPRERGEIVRKLAHTMPNTCTIQWNGDPTCLRSFLQKGLPHDIEDDIIALGSPLRLTREIHVAIPLYASLSQAVIELNPMEQRKRVKQT